MHPQIPISSAQNYAGTITPAELQMRIDKLEMIVEALWKILKQQANLQEEDLIELIAEIDLKDGKLDGKKAKQGGACCPKCKRMNNRRHSRCLYCGEVFLLSPFE